MADSTVIECGTDTSGRPIRMTECMARWWAGVVRELGFEPTIVQGAWMKGEGAAASAGYHDGGGCLDLRTWDLTTAQVRSVIATLRAGGAAAWVRDEARGGMDPHIHFVLGADYGLASGAEWQWTAYLNGRNGLASNGPDYHPRPDPIVVRPPDSYMEAEMSAEEIRTIIREELAAALGAPQSNDKTVKQNIRIAAGGARTNAEQLEEIQSQLIALAAAVAKMASK